MKSLVQACLARFGLRLTRTSRRDPFLNWPDLSIADRRIIRAVQPFTLTGIERLSGLIQAVRYLARSQLPGDVVECGVWRGGSMMAVALTLLDEGCPDRNLYLYDTFTGMSPPTAHDRNASGDPAERLLQNEPVGAGIWCQASLDDVRANLLSTGYPTEKLHFIPGKVEATLPQTAPTRIALLRLDTDWYESTRHELVHLYPRLCPRGVLIIDDYGHWQGARKAVDDYLATLDYPLYLHRLDYTGRLTIKPA